MGSLKMARQTWGSLAIWCACFSVVVVAQYEPMAGSRAGSHGLHAETGPILSSVRFESSPAVLPPVHSGSSSAVLPPVQSVPVGPIRQARVGRPSIGPIYPPVIASPRGTGLIFSPSYHQRRRPVYPHRSQLCPRIPGRWPRRRTHGCKGCGPFCRPDCSCPEMPFVRALIAAGAYRAQDWVKNG